MGRLTKSQIVTMIVFGFSYHEIIYKKRNGPNARRLPFKDPSSATARSDGPNLADAPRETLFRWEFDENGNILGFWQLAPPKFQLLKYHASMSKGILFRTTTYKNNPEGRSVFRSAYRSWFFKKRIAAGGTRPSVSSAEAWPVCPSPSVCRTN